MRSRRAHDRRGLQGEAGNTSRRKVMVVGAGMKHFDEARVRAGRRTNRGHCRRVIRTNFGARMAKIFRENSDSLEHEGLDMLYSFSNKNSLLLITSLITLLLGLSMNAWYRAHRSNNLTFSGTLIQKPLSMPNFELQDELKQRFTEQELRGQYNFLFFGYTHCRGICPSTMMTLTEVYKQIQAQHLPTPRILFITLDPKHDHPSTLRHYVHAFHPTFKGLTGSIKTIRQLSQQMGVVYIRAKQDKPSSQEEEINHSGALYLINPQGQLISIFSPPLKKLALLQDYQRLTQN